MADLSYRGEPEVYPVKRGEPIDKSYVPRPEASNRCRDAGCARACQQRQQESDFLNRFDSAGHPRKDNPSNNMMMSSSRARGAGKGQGHGGKGHGKSSHGHGHGGRDRSLPRQQHAPLPAPAVPQPRTYQDIISKGRTLPMNQGQRQATCGAPMCRGCGEELEENTPFVIDKENYNYHPECFRCVECHDVIPDSQYKPTINGPMCLPCGLPQCALCLNLIVGDLIVANHTDGTPYSFHTQCLKCVQCACPITDKYKATEEGFKCNTCGNPGCSTCGCVINGGTQYFLNNQTGLPQCSGCFNRPPVLTMMHHQQQPMVQMVAAAPMVPHQHMMVPQQVVQQQPITPSRPHASVVQMAGRVSAPVGNFNAHMHMGQTHPQLASQQPQSGVPQGPLRLVGVQSAPNTPMTARHMHG